MASLEKILAQMQSDQANVRFTDLLKFCQSLFGKPRQASGSHVIFKTPWIGDPRVNIQNDHGKAKPYQVRQVLAAAEKIKEVQK